MPGRLWKGLPPLMLDFSAAPLPLVVLAIGNFFFSWAWYSPLLFAHPWMKAGGSTLDTR